MNLQFVKRHLIRIFVGIHLTMSIEICICCITTLINFNYWMIITYNQLKQIFNLIAIKFIIPFYFEWFCKEILQFIKNPGFLTFFKQAISACSQTSKYRINIKVFIFLFQKFTLFQMFGSTCHF